MSHPHTRRHRALGVTSALALVLSGAATAGATAATSPEGDAPVAEQDAVSALTGGALEATRTSPATFEDGAYIVVLAEAPVASYAGGTPGFAPTRASQEAGKDGVFDASTANARSYARHLRGSQDRVLERTGAGASGVHTRYTTAVNGFAGTFTAKEAAKLAADPAVLAVVPDEIRQMDTVSSPDFLGLTGPNGVWAGLVGAGGSEADAGRGVVVGVIDSGIRPESASFQDQDHPAAPADWGGSCETEDEEAFPTASCNDKLIGAKYFVQGFGVGRLADFETLSPLDAGGHGTHTASTAAGNHGVTAVVDGVARGEISGMAPGAHVAAYKACWEGVDGGGCTTSDTLGAIDAAVADGVDVINYSISGSANNVVDPVEIAFLNAAAAGVFVAASSGNSGPTVSSTAHPSPWITTVAASTHAIYEQTLVTGDGQRFIGSSITEPMEAAAPMVYAGEIAAEGADAAKAALCLPGTLDAAAAADRLVVCDRGENARSEKSQVVADAGGAGMVLVNVADSGLSADLHAVPSVHLSHTERDRVLAYARTEGATGQILATSEGTTTKVPEVAGFSSRGPSLAAESDLLKPDISAPGVDVLAAYSPQESGEDFAYVSGTSMSSPHIAGLAALVKQGRPDFDPLEIKSAMMTSARDHASETSPFAGGAGFVDPTRMMAPGLVFGSDRGDWYDYLAGQGIVFANTGNPVSDHPIDASDLNIPSIAMGEVFGAQTVTRTLTDVDGGGTWTATVEGMEGMDVSVSPATFTVGDGQSRDVQIRVAAGSAPVGEFATGRIVWTGPDGRQVRIPVAARPGVLDAPELVEVARTATELDIPVRSGFDGPLTARVSGLTKGTQTEGTTVRRSLFSATDPAITPIPFTYPRGYPKVRIEVEGPADVDLDFYVTSSWSSAPVQRATTRALGGEVFEGAIYSSAPEHRIHVVAKPGAAGESDEPIPFTLRVFFPQPGDNGALVFDPATKQMTAGATTVFEGTLTTDGVSPYMGTVDFLRDGVVVDTTRVLVDEGLPVLPDPEPEPEPETCEVAPFLDIPAGSRYAESTRWMRCEEISTGYADGTYRPMRDVSRGESVTFLYRYLDPEFQAPGASPFRDVPVRSPFFGPITWAAEAGVTTGYADGLFRADDAVTRGEFASFVFRAVGDEDYTAPTESPFPDVKPGSTHYRAIMWLQEQGVVRGYSSGAYGHDDEITRGDISVILKRLDDTLQG